MLLCHSLFKPAAIDIFGSLFIHLCYVHFQRVMYIFSSPGRSPGRAIVLPLASVLGAASVLAKSLTLKFFM